MYPREVAVLTGGSKGPVLDLNFTNGPSSDPRLTFTRAAGGGTYFDATGTLQLAAANQQRVDYGYNPGGATNWTRNNTNQGVVVGGSYPTNWFADSGVDGTSQSIVGTGIENGVPYIDVHWSGTPSASSGGRIIAAPEHTVGCPMTTNQTICGSVYLKLVAGSFANCAIFFRQSLRGYNSAQFTTTSSSTVTPTGAALDSQRFSYAVSPADSRLQFADFMVAVSYTINLPIDFTLRIGGFQQEYGSTPSPLILTSGSAVNVGAIPIGLLIEENRLNVISNPRFEGGTAGTPGTLPTNFSYTTGVAGAGLSTTILGTGTENGMPFLDIRYFGTTAAAGNIGLFFDTGTNAASANAQNWTLSYYLRIIAGSTTNINPLWTSRISQCDVSGTAVANYDVTASAPTTGPLLSQRYTMTALNTNATGVNERGVFFAAVASGVAVDITLRFGCPQLEKQGYNICATSPILPPPGAPAATTRATESVTVSSNGVYNGVASTIQFEGMLTNLVNGGNNANLIRFEDTFIATSKFLIGIGGQVPYGQTNLLNGGESTAVGVGIPFKMAASLTSSRYASSINGGTVKVVANTAMPTGITILKFQTTGSSSVVANAYMSRARIWLRAVSDAELQTNTT